MLASHGRGLISIYLLERVRLELCSVEVVPAMSLVIAIDDAHDALIL
jgi:hypothetical protein